MNKVLFLCLGNRLDLINTAHIISAYKNEHPSTAIDLVTFSSCKDVTDILKNINKVHHINENRIKTIMSSPLYSNAFALNQFNKDIDELRSTQWSKVFNISNDNISAYLMKAIKSDEMRGTYIHESGVAKTTDRWSTLQNYVVSNQRRQSLNRTMLRSHIVQAPYFTDIEKVHIDSDYSIVASQNFNRIRQMKGSAGTFVVGISLESGYDGFTLDEDIIGDTIETLEDSQDYKVVLLLNGKNYQREMANNLNQRFNNSLISINVDTAALPAVIPNLDMLVSCSNDQLAIADLMDTKAIEVRDFSAKDFTPVVSNPNNYVIYQKDLAFISDDILLAINEEFGTHLPISQMTTPNPVYHLIQDDYGTLLSQVRGDLNILDELRYHIERVTVYQMMGYSQNTELINHLRDNTQREEVIKFVSQLKTELTSTVKVLLATLRSLKGVKSSQSNLQNFISYLDTLIRIGKNDNIVGSIIRFFEGEIENIESNDIDENIKSIEEKLFELKSNLQIVTNIMSDLTADVEKVKRQDIGQVNDTL